eukprot:4833441-Prymnesium_polylepis.1
MWSSAQPGNVSLGPLSKIPRKSAHIGAMPMCNDEMLMTRHRTSAAPADNLCEHSAACSSLVLRRAFRNTSGARARWVAPGRRL